MSLVLYHVNFKIGIKRYVTFLSRFFVQLPRFLTSQSRRTTYAHSLGVGRCICENTDIP